MELKTWLQSNSLRYSFIVNDEVFEINEKKFLVIHPKMMDRDIDPEQTPKLFWSELQPLLSSQEEQLACEYDIDYFAFYFGDKWYYTGNDPVQLNVLKYIGTSQDEYFEPLAYLGVHGKYEICSGSRDYSDWCKKAKFMNYQALGICERNTLAGTLSFQQSCLKNGVKPIIGETVTVKKPGSTDIEEFYTVKLFATDDIGWRNLLHINAQIKVFNLTEYVDEEFLIKNNQGLICVIGANNKKLFPSVVHKLKQAFKKDFIYFQIDFVQWSSPEKDKEYLIELKEYIDKYLGVVPPIILCDSYYLDKEEAYVKKLLGQVDKSGFSNNSADQYFKSIVDIANQAAELIANHSTKDQLLELALNSLKQVEKLCKFQINTSELYLPAYELTKEQKKKFESKDELFWSLITEGMENKILNKVEDDSIYYERIQKEVDILEKGGFIDYFLILWDIIDWSKKQDILTGVGRGSAAGSLVAYLLGLVQIDPIEYNLLFERFLNETRITTSFPDIDADFPSDRRDEVKRYMEERFGIDNVISIGTYGTFKIKAAIKDLGRVMSVDLSKANYITSLIHDSCTYEELFALALNIPVLKSFIQDNFKLISTIPLILNQPATKSIHAAGVIITPNKYKGKKMTVYDWIPVKKMDGVLVSEWEGPQLEEAGFLKEDILGIRQLEKLKKIFDLIKIHHNIALTFDDIDINDKHVYELFQNGCNEDVFQFGAQGLKNYCADLKPTDIEDLIATVALYRPGPIESGAHKTYVKIKHGLSLPQYDYMLEEVTKNTHSMYIYQEQTMQAMQVLGGFSLVEADSVRKFMSKKQADKMEAYQTRFVEGAVKNGCAEHEAVQIWNKLEAFSSYGFNRSHAAAYAITGYYCQWLKYHYPLEFWSISLLYSDDKEVGNRIAEMHKISNVKVLPPDINESEAVFKPNPESYNIYWSISSIKQVGEKALEAITGEKAKNGVFFSFEEFLSRIEKRTVNKRVVTNLILSGCFDKLEKIKTPEERYSLLHKYYQHILQDELPEEFRDTAMLWKDYFWILKQKELTGFGFFDFQKIWKANKPAETKLQFVHSLDIDLDKSTGHNKVLVGVISEIVQRQSKKGPFAQITLDCNGIKIICVMWAEIWTNLRTSMVGQENRLLIISGEIKYDSWKKFNVLQTNSDTYIQIL